MLKPHRGRVRTAEHASCDPFRLLERRHGLAEMVEGTPAVGSPWLMLQQRLANGRLGKLWSDEDRIPAWWRSAARGADPNDI